VNLKCDWIVMGVWWEVWWECDGKCERMTFLLAK
jgi:hypothetical protein